MVGSSHGTKQRFVLLIGTEWLQLAMFSKPKTKCLLMLTLAFVTIAIKAV